MNKKERFNKIKGKRSKSLDQNFSENDKFIKERFYVIKYKDSILTDEIYNMPEYKIMERKSILNSINIIAQKFFKKY